LGDQDEGEATGGTADSVVEDESIEEKPRLSIQG